MKKIMAVILCMNMIGFKSLLYGQQGQLDSTWAKNKLYSLFESFEKNKELEVQLFLSFSGKNTDLEGLNNSTFRIIKNEKVSLVLTPEVITIEEKGIQLIIDTFNKIIVMAEASKNSTQEQFKNWLDTQVSFKYQVILDTIFLSCNPIHLQSSNLKSITYKISKSKPVIYGISLFYNEDPIARTDSYVMHCQFNEMKTQKVLLPYTGINRFVNKKGQKYSLTPEYSTYQLINQIPTN